MELRNFRGTFINWESVPTLGEENRYTIANGSRIPQVGDYILVRDVRDYPHDKGVFYGTETIQSTDESIIGRILAQDVHYLAPDVPSGTLVTYDLFLRLRTVSSPLVVYNSLSWRFILQNVWDAEDFDPQRAYFVDDIVRYGGDRSLEEGTYLKYVGSDDIVWDSTDYVPGKLQWVPYEEVDDSFFSDKALESQVKSNADKVIRALANKSSIYWGDRNLTSQAVEGISVGDSYTLSKQSGEEGLSCKAGDILWLNINNTDTGAFGQLYLIASSDCDVSDTSVSTTVRSIIWSGQKGSVWFSGEGEPSNSTAPGAESGDFYLNTLNGYVYSLVDNVWTYKSTIKGRDGASLESIVEHYLASPLTSGVTVESEGWDSVTKLTSDNRNLWNYETITKSNNGSTVIVNTTPRIVGYYSEDGVGVDSITDFYILTDNESHRPSKSDDNWSSTPPTITPALKCLWNYTKVHYTDNSDYESDITLIGRFGDEGQSAYDVAVSHGYQGTEEQWLNTLKGSDGDKWFNSNDTPSDSIGADGDWCLDTSSGKVYHKVNGAWVQDGDIRGDDGDKWFSGSGIPSINPSESREGYYYVNAKEGDYYLNVSNGDVYCRGSSDWGSSIGNIKGPAGPKGSDGVSQYVYIMYSPDPDTNVLHTKDERTDADVWMGICSTTDDTAPSNPGSYEWSKVEGTDAGKLRIRGEWDSNTPYFNGYDAGDPGDDTVNPPIPPREAGDFIDVVYVDDPVYTKGTYACTHTHTSGSVFVPTNWSLMTADGIDGKNGESAVVLTLSNENCSVPSNADGTSPVLTNAKTTATLYVGGDAVTATYRVSNKSNEITLSQSGNEFTVTALEADTCFADIEATYNDNHYVKRFIVTKQKKGADGENAISYWIDKSTSIIKERINSDPLDFDPDEVVFTAMKQVGSDAPIRFTTGYLRLWKNGDSVEDDHGTGTLTVTATEGDNYYTVKLYENSETDPETDPVLDTETVQIIKDGNDGISQYIHIRYAPTDDTSLDDMSDTLRPTDKYLGMSVITSSTPPTRKIDYRWSYFVGEDGTSAVSFRNRGKWKANQTGNNKYVNNDEYIDVVYYETDENSYMCNETHESGATFDSSKWTVLAHKGATGGNGVSEYIHLRYSATDAPHNDMHTPMQSADKYMGVAVNSDKNNPPASPSSYTWSSINAQDGQNVTFNPRDEWTAGAEYVAEDGIIDVVYVDSLGASFACKQSHTASNNFIYDYETMNYWGILNKNGISVTGTSDEYAANNSEDTPPASDSESWGTFAEAIEDIGPTCRFIWNREIVSYNRTTNPTETLTPHIVYRYTEDGKSLKRIEEQYAYGTASAPSSASDAWGTPVKTPSDTAGQQYVWQRERVIYDTDPETSSDPDWSHATPHILSMYLRGNDGKNSISYWIEKSTSIISKDVNNSNSLTPNEIKLEAKFNKAGVTSSFTGGVIKVWKGTDTTGIRDYESTSGSVTFTPSSSVSIYTAILYSDSTELDRETIPIIDFGENGQNGKNAVVAILTNDSSQIPADKDGNVSSFVGATTTIELYEGGSKVTSGLTYSHIASGCKINNGNTTVTGTPTVTLSEMTSDSASVSMKVIYGTETYTKVFTVVKQKQGIPGTNIRIFEISASSSEFVRDMRLSGGQSLDIFVTRQGYSNNCVITANWIDDNDAEVTPGFTINSVTANQHYYMNIPYNSVYDKIKIKGQIQGDNTTVRELNLIVIDKTKREKFLGLIKIPEDVPTTGLLEGDWYISGYTISEEIPKGSVLEYQYDKSNGSYIWGLMRQNAPNGDKILSGLSMLKDSGENLSELSSSNSVSWFSSIVADSLFANQITMSSKGTIQSSNYEETNSIPTSGFKLTSSDGKASFVDADLYGATIQGLTAENATVTTLTANGLTAVDATITGNTEITGATINNITANSLKVNSGTFNGTIEHESLTTYANSPGDKIPTSDGAKTFTANLWSSSALFSSGILDSSSSVKGTSTHGFMEKTITYKGTQYDRCASQNGSRVRVRYGSGSGSIGNNSASNKVNIKVYNLPTLISETALENSSKKVYLIFKARMDSNYTMPHWFYINDNLVYSATSHRSNSERTLFSGFISLNDTIRFRAKNNNIFQKANISWSWEIYGEWDYRLSWCSSSIISKTYASETASETSANPGYETDIMNITTPRFGNKLVLVCPYKEECSIGIYDSSGNLLANCSSGSVTYNCTPNTSYRIRISRPLYTETESQTEYDEETGEKYPVDVIVGYYYPESICNGIFAYVYDSNTANKKGVIFWSTSSSSNQFIQYFESSAWQNWVGDDGTAPPTYSGSNIVSCEKLSGTLFYNDFLNSGLFPTDSSSVFIDTTATRVIGTSGSNYYFDNVSTVRLIPSRGIEFLITGGSDWYRINRYSIEGPSGGSGDTELLNLRNHGVYDPGDLRYDLTTLSSQVRIEVTNIYPKVNNQYYLGDSNHRFISLYLSGWDVEGGSDLTFTYRGI
jgi:hypothetical protein